MPSGNMNGNKWGNSPGLRSGIEELRNNFRLRTPSKGEPMLTVAPTGAGKGTTLIIPNLLDPNTYRSGIPMPVFVTDPKGENLAMTWRAREAMGQRVIAFDPYNVLKEGKYAGGDFWKYHLRYRWCYNPLDMVRGPQRDRYGRLVVDPETGAPVLNQDEMERFFEKDIDAIAGALFAAGNASEKGNDHFTKFAKSLVAGAIAFVLTSAIRAKMPSGAAGVATLVPFEAHERTLATVYDLLLQGADEMALFCALMMEDQLLGCGLPQKAGAAFMALGERERGSMISTTMNGLSWIDRPMRKIMSRSGRVFFQQDENGNPVIDEFGNPVPEMVPELDEYGEPLIDGNGEFKLTEKFEPFSMRELADGKTDIFVILRDDDLRAKAPWFRLMMIVVLSSLKANPSKHGFAMWLDEMAQLRRISELENAILVVRSKGIELKLIWQDEGSAEGIYGRDGWKSFTANVSTRIYMAVAEDETAKKLSDNIGMMTIRTKSGGVSGSGALGGGTSRSASFGETGAKVVTEQQIKGAGKNIFFAQFRDHGRVLKGRKEPYWTRFEYRDDYGNPVYPVPNPFDKGGCDKWEAQGCPEPILPDFCSWSGSQAYQA